MSLRFSACHVPPLSFPQTQDQETEPGVLQAPHPFSARMVLLVSAKLNLCVHVAVRRCVFNELDAVIEDWVGYRPWKTFLISSVGR